jgi:hypothetical protein
MGFVCRERLIRLRPEPYNFLRDAKHKLLAVTGEPAIESDVTPVCPAEVLQGFSEGLEIDLPNLVVFGEAHNHADTPHPAALLRASGLAAAS